MCSFCGDGWRFETTVLGGDDAGRVKAVLHPINVEWEDGYSRPSTGSMVLATRDPAAEDIWPGATGLYISQVLPDGTRLPRFGGYIPKFDGAGGGATTVALRSIDGFLDERLLAGDNYPYTYSLNSVIGFPPPPQQTFVPTLWKPPAVFPLYGTKIAEGARTNGGTAAVAAFLVDVARGNMEGTGFKGIKSLTATWEEPASNYQWVTDVVANWWDFKNIGQMIREFVEAEPGIKYRLEHSYLNGYWSTNMVFSDTIGTARDYTLVSDRELWQYALDVDAENKATRVYGVGQGEEENISFSIAYDADETDNLPEYQVTVAWKDQTQSTILDNLTKGYVLDHRDPTTVPSGTVVGMPMYDPDDPNYDPQVGFPAPEICRPGDTFGVELGYGVITVRDITVRNLGVAWSLQDGAPVQRTIAMQPVVRANTSVRTQTPAKPSAPTVPVTPKPGVPVADPWPTPGKVSNIQSAALTEVSGMEVSVANPGHVWLINDEYRTPDQVSLVKTSTGQRVGFFDLNPSVSPAPVGDPEAIRYSRVSKRLVIADIGDNNRDRPTSGVNQPHLLSVLEPKGGGNKGNVPATRYPIAYPDGKRWNAETLLIHPTTDEVFIITKEASRAQVFSFGALSSMSTVNNVGVLVDTLSNVNQISDGTHTRNGQFVLLRSASVEPTQVFSTGWNRVGQIDTPAMVKSEAIAVSGSCSFLTTSEGVDAPIYRVLIPTKFGATCNGPIGDSGTGDPTGPNGPAVVPGQVINMSRWKLQLPI